MRAGMQSNERVTWTKCSLPWEPWTGAGLPVCTFPASASSSHILQDAGEGLCPGPATMLVEVCHCMRQWWALAWPCLCNDLLMMVECQCTLRPCGRGCPADHPHEL